MRRVAPGPDQESVWDYPRPPALEPVRGPVWVEFAGRRIADTRNAWRVLETSHPPTIYIPAEDCDQAVLERTVERSLCEWKGQAVYWDLRAGQRESHAAGWSYPRPSPAFAAIESHLSFYPSRVDACYLDGERVVAQAGDFYGGWITSRIVGPFKGEPGTRFW